MVEAISHTVPPLFNYSKAQHTFHLTMGVIGDVWHAGGKLRHIFDTSIDENQRRRDRIGAGIRSGIFVMWVLLVGACEWYGVVLIGNPGEVPAGSEEGSDEEDAYRAGRLSGSFTESHVPAAS